ncbi:SLAC1 anion channel family protein [Extensimonas vulgaris]|uniref:Tellurite resistance protein n=1 Tax=Extensimonas vulgaris TaxID=1031594 RepID=A0A369AP41_9BURK|nr:SLAC1 anion channel family protein [Extensimonas vulgaris]RCX10108.1 tellurite resistance protein [Extensimonas vulgaris]TWI36495.1 tellurite resistance protein [Extensimonas vulgaris]TXD17258.1 C4-dicarboxylate ABC transporter [Extensimonas vulgaris]
MTTPTDPAPATHTSAGSAPAPPSLAYLPVALFTTVMGVAGLALAWAKASALAGAPALPALCLRGVATALYVVLFVLYALKALRYPAQVAAERAHPVQVNFFPAISTGMVLLSIAWLPTLPGVAHGLWSVGAAAHLVLTLHAVGSWIFHPHYSIQHASPAWFIPAVGNVLMPIVGMQWAPPDISWFFFSIGVVFWLVLMTIVLYRLFFHEPLPPPMRPTLAILLAPPSAGCVAYLALTGQVDGFARVLYSMALFVFLLLASHVRQFARLPFSTAAWGYSFPLAAFTMASFEMAHRSAYAWYAVLAWAGLALLTVVVTWLAWRTLRAALHGQFSRPQ